MGSKVSDLEKILVEEHEIYSEMLALEEGKRDAILARDERLLDELSAGQEKLIRSVDLLEDKRNAVIEQYRVYNGSREQGYAVSLSEIAARLDIHEGMSLLERGSMLKELLLRFKDIQETNSRMLMDNIEFYGIMMSDLKNRSVVKSGYGSDGKEKGGVLNPLFFNIKA